MKFPGKMGVIIILKVSILSLEIHFSEKHRGNCSSVFEIIFVLFGSTLSEEKKSRQKKTIFFTSDDFFTIFLPTINFYRRIFLLTFFLQARTFSIF